MRLRSKRRNSIDRLLVTVNPPTSRPGVTTLEIACRFCDGQSVVVWDAATQPPESELRRFTERYVCGVCGGPTRAFVDG